MVARSPVRIELDVMRLSDIDAVQRIEHASFPVPWPAYAFRQELETNRLARYIVARAGGEVIGYAGMWLMVDEAHVTTFAVDTAWRRRRVGERLVLALLRMAEAMHACEVTLEVRISNLPARRLYEKFGFRPVGIRPHYYSNDGEDALIMTTEALGSPAMRERLAPLARALDALDAPGRRRPDARERDGETAAGQT